MAHHNSSSPAQRIALGVVVVSLCLSAALLFMTGCQKDAAAPGAEESTSQVEGISSTEVGAQSSPGASSAAETSSSDEAAEPAEDIVVASVAVGGGTVEEQEEPHAAETPAAPQAPANNSSVGESQAQKPQAQAPQGTAQSLSGEEAKVGQAVELYLYAFVAAVNAKDYSLMAHTVVPDSPIAVDQKNFVGKSITEKLLSYEVKNVSISGTNATVEVIESYSITSPKKGTYTANQACTYELQQVSGQWFMYRLVKLTKI